MRKLFALSLLTTAILHLSACRTSLRAQTDGGEAVSVTFKLTGMNADDRSRSDLLYSLSGCGTGAASGTPNADQTITFETRGLRKGDQCDVLVKSGSASTSGIEWFGEPGLIYRGLQTPIQSVDGRLKGSAILQQMYTKAQPPASSLWKITATVKSPAPMTDVCTCLISTDPQIPNNVSKVETQPGGTQGQCVFVNTAAGAHANIECARLVVQCGTVVLRANWPAGTIASAVAGKDHKLPELTLEAGTPEDISDAVIDVYIPQ